MWALTPLVMAMQFKRQRIRKIKEKKKVTFLFLQIDVIASCHEFEDITLRNNEKSVLNKLNKDKQKENIRYIG